MGGSDIAFFNNTFYAYYLLVFTYQNYYKGIHEF